jgi:hypothetical protein
MKYNGHTIYLDQYPFSPKLFIHLWAYKKMAKGTIPPNRKRLPKQAFPANLKVDEKLFTKDINSRL